MPDGSALRWVNTPRNGGGALELERCCGMRVLGTPSGHALGASAGCWLLLMSVFVSDAVSGGGFVIDFLLPAKISRDMITLPSQRDIRYRFKRQCEISNLTIYH